MGYNTEVKLNLIKRSANVLIGKKGEKVPDILLRWGDQGESEDPKMEGGCVTSPVIQEETGTPAGGRDRHSTSQGITAFWSLRVWGFWGNTRSKPKTLPNEQ